MPLTSTHSTLGPLDSTAMSDETWETIHRSTPRAPLSCRACGTSMQAKLSSTGLRFFALGTQSANMEKLTASTRDTAKYTRTSSDVVGRRMRRLTVEQAAQLAEEREAGAEINELAEQFGVDRTTVINHLHRAGVSGRRRQGRTLSPDRIRTAGELYASGVNLLDVAARFSVDRRYLRTALPKAGFALRPPGRQASREA